MKEKINCPICRKRAFDISSAVKEEVWIELKCPYCRNIVQVCCRNGLKELLMKNYPMLMKKKDNNGYNGGTGEKIPKMKRLFDEISKRVTEEWEKDPRLNTDPNFRWTDANRWDKD